MNHYINTLRIGLLSYSPFIDNEDDIILKTIIKEIKAGYYWLIWLTVIEISLDQQNEKKYFKWRYIHSFYKKVSLEKSCIHVLEEINKPEKAYFKKGQQKFINKTTL